MKGTLGFLGKGLAYTVIIYFLAVIALNVFWNPGRDDDAPNDTVTSESFEDEFPLFSGGPGPPAFLIALFGAPILGFGLAALQSRPAPKENDHAER